MNFQYLRLLMLLSVFLLLLSGCGVFIKESLDTSSKPQHKLAYVFGRFSLEGNGPNSMALKLQKPIRPNVTLKYYLKFKPRDDIYAVELDPGVYKLGHIVFLSDLNIVRKDKLMLKDKKNLSIRLEPGKVYYLGDYSGYASDTSIGTYVMRKWNMRGIHDEFQTTLDAFKNAYPNFSGDVEFINLMDVIQDALADDNRS